MTETVKNHHQKTPQKGKRSKNTTPGTITRQHEEERRWLEDSEDQGSKTSRKRQVPSRRFGYLKMTVLVKDSNMCYATTATLHSQKLLKLLKFFLNLGRRIINNQENTEWKQWKRWKRAMIKKRRFCNSQLFTMEIIIIHLLGSRPTKGQSSIGAKNNWIFVGTGSQDQMRKLKARREMLRVPSLAFLFFSTSVLATTSVEPPVTSLPLPTRVHPGALMEFTRGILDVPRGFDERNFVVRPFAADFIAHWCNKQYTAAEVLEIVRKFRDTLPKGTVIKYGYYAAQYSITKYEGTIVKMHFEILGQHYDVEIFLERTENFEHKMGKRDWRYGDFNSMNSRGDIRHGALHSFLDHEYVLEYD